MCIRDRGQPSYRAFISGNQFQYIAFCLSRGDANAWREASGQIYVSEEDGKEGHSARPREGGTCPYACQENARVAQLLEPQVVRPYPVSYTHLRAHETVLDLVCRLLLEKKKK